MDLSSIIILFILLFVLSLLFLRIAPKFASLEGNRSEQKARTPFLDHEVFKRSDFPRGWWTSEKLFDFERNVIFRKTSLVLADAKCFTRPGEYHTFSHPAGYPLFLINGKDNVIRGFHNVCRHRAFPVISSKKSGCSTVLGCKYHGWSYDTKGNLIKAPKFDGIEGFRKDDNGLFEVHVQVDRDGLIFVTTDKEISTDFIAPFANRSGQLLECWEVNANFNWKLAESINSFSIPSLASTSTSGSILNISLSKLFRSNCSYMKPSLLTHVIKARGTGLSLLITCIPYSAERSTVRCILYTTAPFQLEATTVSRIKEDITKSISSLESEYAQVASSNDITDFNTQSSILKLFEVQQCLQQTAKHNIRYDPELTASIDDKVSIAERIYRDLNPSTPMSPDCNPKSASSLLDW